MNSAERSVILVAFGRQSQSLERALGDARVAVDAIPRADDAAARFPGTTNVLLVLAAKQHFGAVRRFVDDVHKVVLDSGAHIIVAPPSGEIMLYSSWIDSSFSLTNSAVGGLDSSSIRVVLDDARTLCNEILRVKCGISPVSSLRIDSKTLPTEHRVLLQRAFGDFATVLVSELVPGKTSAVYRVDAANAAGCGPLPFFVKIGTRNKIVEEYDGFVGSVADYVPFASRPNLAERRCAVGAKDGVLVGHFIEHSEPLSAALMRGASPMLMHAVFEDLLRGWWRRGERDSTVTEPVTSRLRKWFAPDDPARQDALQRKFERAKALNLTAMPPSDLAAKLDQIPKSSHIKSLIHGDLHANNIHVRGTQLILLDFGSVCEGPILADPAALEASIVLETGIECSRLGKLDDWMLFLSRQVYDKGWNTRQLQFETVADSNPLNRSMWSALRILRMHSRNAELNTGDYAAVLVAAFVRVCCFDDSSPAQRAEVAVRLYSIACEIVNAL